jgi:hypothetical protein
VLLARREGFEPATLRFEEWAGAIRGALEGLQSGFRCIGVHCCAPKGSQNGHSTVSIKGPPMAGAFVLLCRRAAGYGRASVRCLRFRPEFTEVLGCRRLTTPLRWPARSSTSPCYGYLRPRAVRRLRPNRFRVGCGQSRLEFVWTLGVFPAVDLSQMFHCMKNYSEDRA